jgi:hypothetical protein
MPRCGLPARRAVSRPVCANEKNSTLSVDRTLLGTSTIGPHPAQSVPAAAPHDPPRSPVACRSAIGRPILPNLAGVFAGLLGHGVDQVTVAHDRGSPRKRGNTGTRTQTPAANAASRKQGNTSGSQRGRRGDERGARAVRRGSPNRNDDDCQKRHRVDTTTARNLPWRVSEWPNVKKHSTLGSY